MLSEHCPGTVISCDNLLLLKPWAKDSFAVSPEYRLGGSHTSVAQATFDIG